MASLWRTQRPRFPLYISDGNGRDYYIKYNNAGYWESQFKIIKKPDYEFPKYNNFHSLFHQAAPFKYIPTGNGRETYIINDNGFYHDQKPLASYKLDDFLREKENSENTKKFKNRKYYMSMSEKRYNNQLHTLEKQLINRLYHKPLKERKKRKKSEFENLLPNLDTKKDGELIEEENNPEGRLNTLESLPSYINNFRNKFMNEGKKKKINKNNFAQILKKSRQVEKYELNNNSRRNNNESDYNIYKDGKMGCRINNGIKRLINCQSENWKYRTNTNGYKLNLINDNIPNIKKLKKNKMTSSYVNDLAVKRFNTIEH